MYLVDKQSQFTFKLAEFLLWLKSKGYQVTLGEAYRPPEMAKIYAAQGKGIKNSVHTLKLAIDLNLFYDGIFLTTFKEYEEAGRKWEGLSTPEITCTWGGRFSRVDANHFSFEHNGVR